MKQRYLYLAMLFVVIGLETLVFAVPPTEATRVEFNQTFTGFCCFSWGESVAVTEPKALVPVVVTLSTDYRLATFFSNAGISVNGLPCRPTAQMNPYAPSDGTFASHTFQWVVLPADGLIQGDNTFTLCGGTEGGGSITLGFHTLAVRFAK